MTHQSEDRLPSATRRFQAASRFLAVFIAFFLLTGSPGGAHIVARTGTAAKQPPAAGEEEEIRLLEPGKSVRREISGGQSQGYQIGLRAGQYLKVIVEQEGIDVVIVMIGPDGKRITEFDSESLSHGREPVTRVAERNGDYLLLVQPRQRSAPAGYYQIRIDQLRAATESDRALQEARLLCEECLEKQVMGPPARKRTAIERALEIRERVLGPDNPEVAAALNGLGRIYRGNGDFATAETLFQRALGILEKTIGTDNPALADSLNNLGHLYRNQADYAKAEAMFQRSLAISQRSLGPEHPNYAFALHNLGLLNWSKGNYTKAEQFFLQALAIWKRALNPDNPQLALAHFGLGNFYRYRGEYARAEAFYQEALSIWEKAFGPNNPDVARTLNNLAIVYREEGNYEKAEPLANRALSILEKVAGPDNPDAGRTLNNLALISHACGDQRKAELLANRSLDILKALGPETSDVAASLNTLALIKRAGGDYAEAERLFQRSLAISEKVLGPKHPYVADVLDELAMLHATMGDTAHAIAYQRRSDEISEANLALNLEVGSERQKQAYQAMLAKQTDRTLTLHLRYAPHDPAARNLAATIILQRKGRELDATSQSLGALRSRSDAQDRALFDRLSEVRSRIAALILGEPRISTGQYHEEIGKLEETAGKLEFEISSRSSEFRSDSLPITLKAVQAAIPAGTALIEFVSYRPYKAGPSGEGGLYEQPRYVAYVLRREGGIRWKELGEASQIDKAIESLREALRDPLREDVKGLARKAYARIFQPIQPFLPGMTRLLISPDSLLNVIPFEVLIDQQGRYLVQRYSISYLTSGRDLLRLQIPRDSKGGPLIIADPDFGRRSQGTMAQLAQEERGAPEVAIQDQRKWAASTFREYNFLPLPYSAQEGKTLRELLPEATLLTRREATKTALSQVRSPSLLHIATHGFFLEGSHSTGPGLRSHGKSEQLHESGEISTENPLLRSGLVLAGANEQREDDNGIMTALEMTGLDLWGTRLVVLSACDTGIGEVKVGDGIHGLRRALVLAGAESQVISLWAISDKATRDLMIGYYRLLKQGEGRGDALRKEQLKMLKSMNWGHPHYWACFIQSGEWANLAGRR